MKLIINIITQMDFLNRLNKDKLLVPYIVITDERDEDLGIEAVKKGGSALRFADPFLQTDHEIVRAAS